MRQIDCILQRIPFGIFSQRAGQSSGPWFMSGVIKRIGLSAHLEYQHIESRIMKIFHRLLDELLLPTC